MEKLTIDHINGLIDTEEYVVTPQYIQCILMVGEAPIIGTSYCFHQNHIDVPAGKASARRDAIAKLFDAEAYHQKRLRKNSVSKTTVDIATHTSHFQTTLPDHMA